MTMVHYDRIGEGPPLILLHATLSSSRQLRTLATKLSERYSVISVDRRGSGRSATDAPATAIDVATHVEDLVAIMAQGRLGPAFVVGHSYGGCIALELAARHPDRVVAVFAYEPPYGSLAPPEAQAHMAEVGRRTHAAAEHGDLVEAALAFMAGVSGPEAVAALSPAARARIGRAGQGAVADATLLGMDATGLRRIKSPTRIATGSASLPLYADIADVLATRIDGANHQRLKDLGHMAPIVRPDAIAAAIGAFRQP
jgi:pimeloyl-ACP methyl ester carboxylesterase